MAAGALAGIGAAAVVSGDEATSFHCHACGRCCNSPPAMTVAELFHHEDRFVGSLCVARGTAPGTLALWTQGHDYPSLAACPARLDDGRCGVHDDGKPAQCRAVPLDPRRPEAAQAAVLVQRRRDAAFMAADCLVAGEEPGLKDAAFAPLVRGAHIVDAGYRADFLHCRDAQDADAARWRDAVLALLRPALATLPPPRPGGWLALPLVPVLQVLASQDAERCRRHAQRQVALIEANVARALARRRAEDRGFTEELRRFAAHYRRWLAAG